MDRNFDDLAVQFSQRIYSGAKGQIRLALLERDLREVLGDTLVSSPLTILDAGGGEGQFARGMAALGHHVTLCDHSEVMLSNARQEAAAAGLADHFNYLHSSIQSLSAPDIPYDLVLCHAVLEWVQDWQTLISILQSQLKEGGYLSLMFYNRHSTVFRSLVRGYFDRINNDKLQGSGKGLTPLYPLLPEDVLSYLAQSGWNILSTSGIRVFHDYMHKEILARRSVDDIIELEKRFSREEPYRSLGRYYHVIVQRVG